MNRSIFEAFEAREKEVSDYMAGCGMRYGQECTCGPGCRCKNCPIHPNPSSLQQDAPVSKAAATNSELMGNPQDINPEFFDSNAPISLDPNEFNTLFDNGASSGNMSRRASKQIQRNPSVISFGGNAGLRHMSLTSETTFGRAMSGLSALAIDWENLEDFDVEVDHSAHINNSEGGKHHVMSHQNSPRRSGNSLPQQPLPILEEDVAQIQQQQNQQQTEI